MKLMMNSITSFTVFYQGGTLQPTVYEHGVPCTLVDADGYFICLINDLIHGQINFKVRYFGTEVYVYIDCFNG
jgi:hypothetical protein